MSELCDKILQLETENQKMRVGLWRLSSWAERAYDYWDSDDNREAGRILLAMAGELPGFCAEIDEILTYARPDEVSDE